MKKLVLSLIALLVIMLSTLLYFNYGDIKSNAELQRDKNSRDSLERLIQRRDSVNKVLNAIWTENDRLNVTREILFNILKDSTLKYKNTDKGNRYFKKATSLKEVNRKGLLKLLHKYSDKPITNADLDDTTKMRNYFKK